MPKTKPKLRKREVGFALAMGLMAATGAALFLEGTSDSRSESAPMAAIETASDVDYDLVDFDEISTTGPQDLVITQGDSFSVRAQGSQRALDQLEAVVENQGLVIRPREDSFFGDWGSLESAKYFITLPQLDRVALAGTGDIRVDGLQGDRFEAIVGGSGEMRVSDLDVGEVEFGIFGSGDLTVNGTAQDVSITIGGSGEVDGDGLRSQTASIAIGGSGEVDLTVEEEARISITGSGDVDIGGPAICSVTRMGGGVVSCEGGGGDES